MRKSWLNGYRKKLRNSRRKERLRDMAVHSRWIQMALSFILMLQFTGALSGDLSLSFTVRDGDKVTLPCENLISNHHSCDTTTWIFTGSRSTTSVELVSHGQIAERAKSDRLNVTAGCSLDIKKVTAEDVGHYTCRQFTGNPVTQQGPDAEVLLSVIIVTEKKDGDTVTLSCSVQVYDQCEHKVKWIHNRDDLNRDYSNVKTSQSSCSAIVTFISSSYISRSDFKCSVTTEDNKEHSSDMATTTTTLYPNVPGAGPVWPYILGVVILVAVLIVAVKLIWLKRLKGKKTQANGNSGLTLDPAVTQNASETRQETANHEDGVSYASISYTNKTHSKNKDRGKNSDESETVTYATVKASSTDPSSLYATIK